MEVAFHGTGYVGLVTGACMADTGNRVICVDIDAKKIESLQRGEIPIYEPGLESIVKRNIANGRLRFTTDISEAVAFADFQFIAVGTPPDEDGSADMQYVLAVADAIGKHMTDYKVIINKSTVPVGTADRVCEAIKAQLSSRGEDIPFDVVSNPEFLKEGAAVNDFMKPHRIIIGTDSDKAANLMKGLYEPFNRNHERIFLMDLRSAELTKYAANTMLATKISFMNELAGIAEKLGADIESVRVGIGSDPRIGYEFIYPGCGFGGSCFPKDVRALARSATDAGFSAELIEAVERVNDRQKEVVFQKLAGHFDNDLQGKTIALWGLAFKPNTDDMREAPSINFINATLASGANIRAYDPVAMDEAQRIYKGSDGIEFCASATEALTGSDALVLLTEWQEFRSPDFEEIKGHLSAPVVVDGRNVFDPAHMSAMGFKYYAIGRGG